MRLRAAASVALLCLAAGVHAQTILLDSVPAWSSSQARLTEAIAWGDLDADGDLDLVCGNFGQALTMFRNDAGQMSAAPAWSSQLADPTRAVALGDLDGDGWLDLVVGNWGAPNRIYLNRGGSLDDLPFWSSSLDDRTNGIALGDIDGDGDLDLASGATGAPTRIYLNTGGIYSTTPDWSSSLIEDTRAVAFGDVDGDGNLDLACGNSGSPARIYLNQNGTLLEPPDWSSQTSERARALAFGDLDGDGNLDLACANDGSPNTVYLNLGTRLDERVFWSGTWYPASQSVAWGDADSDGDLDLAFGNSDLNNASPTIVYENQDGQLLSTPAWSTQVGERTSAVAWGDFDSDGDLDLALGNHARPSRIYRNDGGDFFDLVLPLGTTGAAQSVALGDFDADGDLDLASGKFGVPTDVFRNENGSLQPTADWSSSLSDPTRRVAWADVNGDGYPELAVANDGAACRLYGNDAGRLSDAPIWTSALVEATQALAFADLDGDGDFDLACANFDSPNRVYENLGDRLARDPLWSSELSGPTSALAFGDMNGDGTLDLAIASFEGPVHVYLNFGGNLETTPAWVAELSEATSSLAWGDVDGDGDLDLACGNIDNPIRIYTNRLGLLETLPSWSSVFSERISSIAFADADGDGDLDLACGIENTDASATPGRIYRNVAGELRDVLTLKAQGPMQTTDVAWGDIDGDGDPDLVLADGSASPFGRDRALVNRFGMPASASLLVNNPTRLRNVQIRRSPSEANRFEIHYVASDPESDPFRLRAEYVFQGDSKPIPMFLDARGEAPKLLTSSPSGSEHSFEWDILRVPSDPRPVTILLRAVELPARAGQIQYGAPARRDIDRLVPQRPQISIAPEAYDFGTVCVGDSSALVMYLSNRGSELLELRGVVTPSIEVSLSTLPESLEPGFVTLVAVGVQPRSGLPIGGSVIFSSNDPVRPDAVMRVDVQVQTLDFSFTRLDDRDPWPLGESVGILVEPANSFVHIERGAVYFRIPGATSFAAAALERVGNSFGAAIPAQMVTELGLEYYIEVENSGVFAFDPPGAPAQVHVLNVALPAAITSIAQPNLGNEVAEGLDLTVSVGLPIGAQFDSGFLHFRSGGDTDYWTAEIVKEPFVRGLIGAEHVNAKGLEYWVEVTTVSNTHLTDPPLSPAESPRAVRVGIGNAVEPFSNPGGRYRLLSIPVEFPQSFSGTLLDLLAEQASFGNYDPLRWRSYRYVDAATVEWTRTDPRFRPEPGRAFWLISRDAHQVDTTPILGLSVPTDVDFQLELAPGWNQFGNPFAFPVAWDEVQKPAEIVDLTAFDSRLGSRGAYSPESVTTLEPFQGYFVRNAGGAPVQISIPANRATTSVPKLIAATEPSPLWMLRLTAQLHETQVQTVLGVDVNARAGTDAGDRMAPPPAPGPWLQFGSAVAADTGALYRQDLRPIADAQRFELVLRSREGGEPLELRADLSRFPADAAALLLDRETGATTDLRTLGAEAISLLSLGDGADYRLTLLAGDAAAVTSQASALIELPQRVVLDQNAPNPFNPATRIRFGLPASTRVSLRIFNLRGERVQAICENELYPAGYHTLIWDGRDERGGQVASGVYLYSLETPELVLHRKMLLVQ